MILISRVIMKRISDLFPHESLQQNPRIKNKYRILPKFLAYNGEARYFKRSSIKEKK